jgi:hypothetical protein
MMDFRVAPVTMQFYIAPNSKEALFKKVRSDQTINTPITKFIDILDSLEIKAMKRMTFSNLTNRASDGFDGDIGGIEIADLNLREHRMLDDREEIELSMVVRNRFATYIEFGHTQINMPNEVLFKNKYIDYIKPSSKTYDYELE